MPGILFFKITDILQLFHDSCLKVKRLFYAPVYILFPKLIVMAAFMIHYHKDPADEGIHKIRLDILFRYGIKMFVIHCRNAAYSFVQPFHHLPGDMDKPVHK